MGRWRSNPQEPEVRASSHCSEQLRGEGGMDEDRIQYSMWLDKKWVGCDISSVVIPITISS